MKYKLNYFLLLNYNPQFQDRKPCSPTASPRQIVIIVGKLKLHPKIQVSFFIFWAVMTATSWHPESYRNNAMKAYKESRDTAPPIIRLSTFCFTEFYILAEWKLSCVSRVTSLSCISYDCYHFMHRNLFCCLSPRHGASSGCGWRNGLRYGG
jgi:hypothetical protein